MCIFSKPKTPEPPPPPPKPPEPVSESTIAARLGEKRRQALSLGREGTILSGLVNNDEPSTRGTTLIGRPGKNQTL